MEKIIKDYLKFRKKKVILEIASETRNITKFLREYDIPKSTYYKWKKAYETHGDDGLKRKKPIASTHPRKIKPQVIEKVLYIRENYKMGSWRIKWYLERYHGICISESSVSRILRKNGVNKLGKSVSKRSVHTKRYSKKMPGHHVQMDVKFVTLKNNKVKVYAGSSTRL